MAYQFEAHIMITGQITCLSGLHIGGTEEGYEIGGMDNPVIKDKISNYPYIPGSSLKGKMRSMTEWIQGKVKGRGEVHTCADPQCKVCRIFGTSAAEQHREEAAGPTRLLVRDAHLAQETLNDERYVSAGVFQTETKTENSLNRITSVANPRPMERVPRGAKFDFELVYGVYDMGDRGRADIENLAEVAAALDMLQASVLGGGGSRGSYMVMDAKGEPVLDMLGDEWRYKPENSELREAVLETVIQKDGAFTSSWKKRRPLPEEESWFENVWGKYMKGEIFEQEGNI